MGRKMGIDYKFWRIKNKLKLKEIADFIGCSTALLSMYENDKVEMDHLKRKEYERFIEDFERKV